MLPRVPLSACLQRWQEPEEMGDYFSAALNRKTRALRQMRFASFPPFLVLQLNRYITAMISSWIRGQAAKHTGMSCVRYLRALAQLPIVGVGW